MIPKPYSLEVSLTILALIIVPTLTSSTFQSLTSVATLTTLPPASPTGNNTDPCAFSDRMVLFNRIHKNIEAYNVSLLVGTCPNICTLVYGSGNPDISGIGAMISYIIQGISVFFFGPWLGLAARIFDVDYRLPQPLAKWHRQAILLANISIYISQGSIFVALSTSIASLIRLTHTPPLHEQYFLKSLNKYQLLVSIRAMIPLSSISGYQERKVKALRVFGIAACVLSMTAFLTKSSESNAQVISQFDTSCLDDPTPNRFGGSAPEMITLAIFSLGWIVFTLINAVFEKTVREAINKVETAIRPYFHTTLESFVISMFGLFLAISWTKWGYQWILKLQDQRRKAQSSSGEAYEDHKWGFGQVTIMLLWAPLINDIILDIIEYFRPQSSSNQRRVALNRSVEDTVRLNREEQQV